MYQYAFFLFLILIILCKDNIEQFSNDTCDIYEYKFKKLEETIMKNNLEEKQKKNEPQPDIIINNYIQEDEEDEDEEDEDEEVLYSNYDKNIMENRVLLYIIITSAIILFIIITYNIIRWFMGDKEYIDISYDEAMNKVKNDLLMKKHGLKIN